MNRVFKVVWNKSMNRWDVTSEIGSSRKKAKRSTMSKVAVSVIAGALALGGVAMAAATDASDESLKENYKKNAELNVTDATSAYTKDDIKEGLKNIEIGALNYTGATNPTFSITAADKNITIGKVTVDETTNKQKAVNLTLDGVKASGSVKINGNIGGERKS